MNIEYRFNNNPFDEIEFIPEHDGIQPQFIVRRYKNDEKYVCNFHMYPNRETKKELISAGMNYLFDIPIGYYNVSLTGINQINDPFISDFILKFTSIDTIRNQNNGGDPIRSYDINFQIP